MAKTIHIKRIREQNRQFLVGHRAHPNELKGYRNIEPTNFFNRNEKRWATNAIKRAKHKAIIKKLGEDDKKLAIAAKPKISASRASARITLKNKPKVLKDFVGEGKKARGKKRKK